MPCERQTGFDAGLRILDNEFTVSNGVSKILFQTLKAQRLEMYHSVARRLVFGSGHAIPTLAENTLCALLESLK